MTLLCFLKIFNKFLFNEKLKSLHFIENKFYYLQHCFINLTINKPFMSLCKSILPPKTWVIWHQTKTISCFRTQVLDGLFGIHWWIWWTLMISSCRSKSQTRLSILNLHRLWNSVVLNLIVPCWLSGLFLEHWIFNNINMESPGGVSKSQNVLLGKSRIQNGVV